MTKQIIFDFYNTIYNPSTEQLFSGIETLLLKLKCKYCLILVTTYSLDRKRTIKKLGLSKYFQKIIICKQKNLLLFSQLTKLFKFNLVIGDRENEELLFAKLLKIKTIKVSPDKENPSITITKILKNIL